MTWPHSGGNDSFCAKLKTDISAFSSGLQGHLRSCLTILDSSWWPLSKNVRHDLVRPQRPELEAEMSVFNLAQKLSFPPLCREGLRNDEGYAAQQMNCLYRIVPHRLLHHWSTLVAVHPILCKTKVNKIHTRAAGFEKTRVDCSGESLKGWQKIGWGFWKIFWIFV
jgi:hypothetical protein